MTNKQKCLKQWRWIVAHPGSDKLDWAEAHPKEVKEVKDHALCYACLETFVRETGCKACPIRWSVDEQCHCCFGENPYKIWNADKTAANAKAVLEVIKNTWK